MKCPVDDETLVMTERNGVEIDYCPKCRGVWLDRGELDKIIERAGSGGGGVPQQQATASPWGDAHPQRHEQSGYRKKKKESFLSDIFDF